jgi:hypothetical protein
MITGLLSMPVVANSTGGALIYHSQASQIDATDPHILKSANFDVLFFGARFQVTPWIKAPHHPLFQTGDVQRP